MNQVSRLQPRAALGVGAAAGLLSGLLGIGGGLLIGPVLALLGMPLARALGTSLVAVAPIATVAVLAGQFTAPERVAWLTALLIAAGGQIGAPLGARLVVSLSATHLRRVFIAFLLLAAARSLAGPLSGAVTGLLEGEGLPAAALALGLGTIAGISASLFGIGGGVVVVPGLVFLHGGFGFQAAAATSLAAMVPTALRGAWIASRQGRVEAGAARWLVPTALASVVAGVVLRDLVLPPAWLQRLFGLFLLYAAWRLFRSGQRVDFSACDAGPGRH